MTHWIQITACLEQPPEDWSVFADAFDRFGCPGSIVQDSPSSISAYLGDVPNASNQAEALATELRRLGAERVEIQVVPDEDWSEIWKQHFRPMRLGRRIVVRPTWETVDLRPGDIEISIDPGQAFGTGDHPTTRLCLRLMDGLNWNGLTVADVGCGSGILGIAALKLGASSVVGTDIDRGSVEVSRTNADINGVQATWLEGNGFEPLGTESYDVVLSNIISAVLIRLAPDVANHVSQGGIWLLSGVIESNWGDVSKAAERAGFKLIEHIAEDEWVAATFRRV